MGFAFSSLQVTSPDFAPGGEIPPRHTGGAENLSPRLNWSGAPEVTESFAVFCHDPDAPLVTPNGTYGLVHWVLYNIPARVTGLPEGVSGLYTTGPNQLGKEEYHGPQPPPGHGRHHYFFGVLALTIGPSLEAGLNLWQFLRRVEPNVIGLSRVMGTFENGAE